MASNFRTCDFASEVLVTPVPMDALPDFRTLAAGLGDARLEPATVYKRDGLGVDDAGAEVVDSDVRRSSWARDRTPRLLEAADNILRALSGATKISFTRLEDHVTVVGYEPGEFFKPHQDAARIVAKDSLRALEVHVLVTLEAPEEGGELRVHWGDRAPQDITCRRGEIIAFNKAQMHEALPVVRGRKRVLLIDALATAGAHAPHEPCLFPDAKHPGFMSTNVEAVAEYARRRKLPFFLLTLANDGYHRQMHDISGQIYYKGSAGTTRLRDDPYDIDEALAIGWEWVGPENVADWNRYPVKYDSIGVAESIALASQHEDPGTQIGADYSHVIAGALVPESVFAGQEPVPKDQDPRELLAFREFSPEAPSRVLTFSMTCNQEIPDYTVYFVQKAGVLIPPDA